MKAVSQWLQDYLDKTLSTEQMATALEAAGIEVEQIVYTNKLDQKIVSAKVKKVVQHPTADKLKIAKVDNGQQLIEVVCGAPNLQVGQSVALAQVGAKLPDGTIIKSTQIRGQTSAGMLCSELELGLGTDHNGILVLSNVALGKPLSKVLIGSDVIDVTTPANRFDLLSYVGLAREIAAQTGAGLKLPPGVDIKATQAPPEVIVAAQAAVRRYLLVELSINSAHPTASWAAQRLEAAGIRSINLPVDVTNYTMLELGQPLHAFDAHKVTRPITVRMAKTGETLQTLDGQNRSLSKEDLVIADANGPIALAGVMGGKRTEVEATTTVILLESASFDASVVRKMAQRHGLRTEASARFERLLPWMLPDVGLQRCVFNLQQAAKAKIMSAVADLGEGQPVQTRISVEPQQVAKVLSLEVGARDLVRELPKLGLMVQEQANTVTVDVPWWRPDLVLAEDIAEEYIRLVGFDEVQARLPKWQPQQAPRDEYWARLWRTKASLKGLGLFEVMTYSFISAEALQQFGYRLGDHLKLKNPLSSEQAYLRRNLLASLHAAAIRNQLFATQFGLYETSRVFIPKKLSEQPQEPTQLAVLVKAKTNGYQAAKSALDTLAANLNLTFVVEPKPQPEFLSTRSVEIKVDAKTVGRLGELHPRFGGDFKGAVNLGYLELDLDQFWSAAQALTYRPISRFPSLYRDLAVVVPEQVLWQDVAAVIAATELARPSFLNDYYDSSLGKGHKSLAMRLEMSSPIATLTDKDASKRLDQIMALLAQRFGATIRS